jgi:hypothetical protein
MERLKQLIYNPLYSSDSDGTLRLLSSVIGRTVGHLDIYYARLTDGEVAKALEKLEPYLVNVRSDRGRLVREILIP